MFHHCNPSNRLVILKHLNYHCHLTVTWHLLAADSKLVEIFQPTREYSLQRGWQRKIVYNIRSECASGFWHDGKSAFILLAELAYKGLVPRHLQPFTVFLSIVRKWWNAGSACSVSQPNKELICSQGTMTKLVRAQKLFEIPKTSLPPSK